MSTIVKNRELRNKILIILFLMILIRIGSVIPLPGVNTTYLKIIFENDAFSFLNLLTGYSLSQMSFFGLSISPYITASIIVQLLTVVFPKLEEIAKDGSVGKEKMEHITFGVTIGLALLQSLALSIGFGSQGLLVIDTWWMVLIMTCVWTAGAGVLVLIGNWITKLDLGSGISYILLFNILSTFFTDLTSLYEVFFVNHGIGYQVLNTVLIVLTFGLIVFFSILLSTSERKIPVTFSGKMSFMGARDHLPIPLNLCGVMPIIFTGSVLSIPAIVSNFVHKDWLTELCYYFTTSQWFRPGAWRYTLGMFLYIFLAYVFTFFYMEIDYNTVEMASNLQKQGATIPGIRAGKPTAEYLSKIATKMAVLGTTLTLLLILTTAAVCNLSGIGTLNIGGTSILICVSVMIDSSRTIQTAIQSVENRSYYTQKGERPARLFGLAGRR